MRAYLLGLGLVALTASASLAQTDSHQTDSLGALTGNTVIVVDKGGMESHTVYSADHSFAGNVPAMSYDYKGTWAIDDKGRLCRTFDPPVPGRTNPDCESMTAHAIGDKWTSDDGSSETLAAATAMPATDAMPASNAAPAPAAPATPATPAMPATPAAPATTPNQH